jgi:hypothetical protein
MAIWVLAVGCGTSLRVAVMSLAAPGDRISRYARRSKGDVAAQKFAASVRNLDVSKATALRSKRMLEDGAAVSAGAAPVTGDS